MLNKLFYCGDKGVKDRFVRFLSKYNFDFKI